MYRGDVRRRSFALNYKINFLRPQRLRQGTATSPTPSLRY